MLKMKILQPKLSVGNEGKVLIDTTNLKTSTSKNKKRKSDDNENFEPTKVARKDGIYSDPPPPISQAHFKKQNFIDIGVQTEHVDSKSNHEKVKQIKKMLTDENPPSDYWEIVAENRREALEVTLKENRALTEENEFLKGENKVLEEMLEEAKQLASLVQELTNSEEESERNNVLTETEQEFDTEANDESEDINKIEEASGLNSLSEKEANLII